MRPAGADGAEQAAQNGADFPVPRPLGRVQHGGDEAAFAVVPDTGDRPGSGIIGSTMTGTSFRNARIRLQQQILNPFNGLRYTHRPTCSLTV